MPRTQPAGLSTAPAAAVTNAPAGPICGAASGKTRPEPRLNAPAQRMQTTPAMKTSNKLGFGALGVILVSVVACSHESSERDPHVAAYNHEPANGQVGNMTPASRTRSAAE